MDRASTASSQASSLAPRADAPTRPPALMRGPEDEAERVARRGAVDAGGVGQGAQAGIVSHAQDSEALGDEGAVHALEGHHVAHGRERHEIEKAEEIRLWAATIEAVAPQDPRRLDKKQKNQARRGEVPLSGKIVEAVRVHEGGRVRQRLIRLVMVDDEHVGAGVAARSNRFRRRRSAIDREDEARARLREIGQDRLARSVALGEPVWDIRRYALAVRAHVALHEGDRGRAVDIIVAEDGDALFAFDGTREAGGRRLHVLQGRGVRQQAAQRGIKMCRGRLAIGATSGEDASQELRQAIGLGDRCRDQRTARMQPLHPAIGTRGAFDAEDGRCGILFKL